MNREEQIIDWYKHLGPADEDREEPDTTIEDEWEAVE
ncbi:hypothetical protein WS74_0849 [Weissella ceti]|uniref:Uncharacterized protein n=1 Tax=Weissella ceti TaxID=759620 RepID=A0A088GGJ7_9LACO|nr:hypothetical protein WS74_0849 [Weissella ceti]